MKDRTAEREREWLARRQLPRPYHPIACISWSRRADLEVERTEAETERVREELALRLNAESKTERDQGQTQEQPRPYVSRHGFVIG
jgi:hypothetical protein